MPINKKFNIIFVHIPKAAGTSVEKVLDMSSKENFFSMHASLGKLKRKHTNELNFNFFTEQEKAECEAKNLQHFSIKELKKLLDPEFFNSAFKFSVIRNPYHRIVSEYFYIKAAEGKNPDYQDFNVRFPTFASFVETELQLPKYDRILKYDAHLEPQSHFLLDENNSLSDLNKIYKFETELDSYFNFCYSKANIKNINIHAREGIYEKDYSKYYNEETRDLVYNFYKQDFELFGYDINI